MDTQHEAFIKTVMGSFIGGLTLFLLQQLFKKFPAPSETEISECPECGHIGNAPSCPDCGIKKWA